MSTFNGVFTALITPFQANGKIDEPALRNLVESQIAQGITGLVPVGTTGESPTLSHEEHSTVIGLVTEQTRKRVPVIAGTGSNNTQEAIELTLSAREHGADASLQVAPYYNKPSQEGLYRHFIEIAEKTELPLIIYNIPGRTGKNIEVNTIVKLSKHPMIVGVKEATGNITQAIDIIHATNSEEFSVLSGDDALTLGMMVHGGCGVVSVASNVLPNRMVTLTKLAHEGHYKEARKEYMALLPFFRSTFIDTNPVPIKYAAHKLGLCEEVYRLPLCPLNEEQKAQVDAELRSLRLL